MLLREDIYEALRSEVLTCRLSPNQEIREQELATRYAVSRSPVREALSRLAREGLVTVTPRQGYRVNPISVADAEHLFSFRAVVEPACAEAAARRASDDVLRDLDRFRRGHQEADFVEYSFIAYNRAFHRAVAQACGNPRMAATACELMEQADRMVLISVGSLQGHDTERLVAEHEAMIDALQARNARLAAQKTRTHIANAHKRIVAALKRSAIMM